MGYIAHLLITHDAKVITVVELFCEWFFFSICTMASCYASFSLERLRAECRKRRAKTTGRKAELVERLIAYDRNQDFGNTYDAEEDAFRMALPAATGYFDINNDTKLPPVSMIIIEAFLRQNDTKLNSKIQELYEDSYLNLIRHSAASQMSYIKANVRASMKSTVTYFTDVSVDPDGIIIETQCDCAVGMGPTATCKHVQLTLFALSKHTDKEPIKTFQTCTQKLQKFHVTKPSHGSPQKSVDIKLKLQPTMQTFKFKDPRTINFNSLGYPSRFRNTMLSYRKASTMPVAAAYEPANTRGVDHDHPYAELTKGDIFLEKIGLIRVDSTERKFIEAATLKQRSASLWDYFRMFRLTSSNFGKICKGKDKDKVALDLLERRNLDHVPAIRHGQKYESVAVVKFESLSGLETVRCGLFVHDTFPMLASSPDRLVDFDGVPCVVEVKCPFAARAMPVEPKTVPYLIHDEHGALTLKKGHDYYYQVQGQMACTGRTRCVFIVYTSVETKFFVIHRDDMFIDDMLKQLISFFDDHFKKALIEKFVYRDFSKIKRVASSVPC